jgi:predicted DNA-binding transcriptional regulator YafY
MELSEQLAHESGPVGLDRADKKAYTWAVIPLETSNREAAMPDYAKYRSMLHHLILIDDEIRSGSYPNTSTLARQLELSPRTIGRKIEFMRDVLRAPVEYDSSRKGYNYTEPSWSLPSIQISEGELLGIIMAQMALQAYRDTPLGGYLNKVVDKLVATLPKEVKVKPGDFGSIFRFNLGPVAPMNPKHWEILARAARERRTIEMRYYILSKDEVVDRVVDPYLLRCFAGDWYLIGRDQTTGYVPVYSLARIRKLRLTDEHFDIEGFDPDEYLGGTFQVVERKERHKVKIRFSGTAGRIVAERIWHPSQQLTEKKDGSVVLTMTVADLGEVGRWILTWGAEAKVLAPKGLVAIVQESASEVAGLYAQRPGATRRK